jgi:sugar/nucleoside kinase (ribokinase family)
MPQRLGPWWQPQGKASLHVLPRYLAVGGLRIDYIITADQQVHLREMGGNAIFAAVGARIWAADVGIVSRVGENYPAEWLERLSAAGLTVAGVHQVPGWQDMRTFYAYLDRETRDDTEPARHFARIGLRLPDDLKGYVHSTPGQDSPTLTALGPRSADLPVSHWQASAAHLSPMPLTAHRDLSRALSHRGISVTLDPGERYMLPQRKDDVLSLLPCLDAFLPSKQEARSMLGPVDLWQAAELFAQAGPEVVVVKAGSQGSLVLDCKSRKRWRVPAYPVEIVDVTGAGDAYCGGFMVGYDETGDAVLAACYGTVSASFVLQGFGALYALRFSRVDAEARLAHLRDRVEES